MGYKRKTRDVYNIFTRYPWSTGWECECSEYTYKEALQRYHEYKENTCAIVWIKKTRERIVDNVSEEVC